MPYVPRPWWYAASHARFAAHVRLFTYRQVVQLYDEVEAALAGCERHDSTGRALAVNRRRLALVVAELSRRATTAVAEDLRTARRRVG